MNGLAVIELYEAMCVDYVYVQCVRGGAGVDMCRSNKQIKWRSQDVRLSPEVLSSALNQLFPVPVW